MSAIVWAGILLVGYLLLFTGVGEIVRHPLDAVKSRLLGRESFSPQNFSVPPPTNENETTVFSGISTGNKYLDTARKYLSGAERKASEMGVHLLFSALVSFVIFVVLLLAIGTEGIRGLITYGVPIIFFLWYGLGWL